MRVMKVRLLQVVVLLCVVFLAHVAFADSNCTGTTTSCSFYLGNSGVSGGPFVQVTVDLNKKTGDATITFTAMTGVGIVNGSSLALNVNTAYGWSGGYGSLTSTGETLTPSCVQCSSANNVDGFGTFNLIFDQKDASNPASSVSVTLTGGGWSSAAQVLVFNTKNNGSMSSAASHVLVGGCTFYVADGPTISPATCGSTSAAEPSVYLGLLSLGVVGIPFVRRKLFA